MMSSYFTEWWLSNSKGLRSKNLWKHLPVCYFVYKVLATVVKLGFLPKMLTGKEKVLWKLICHRFSSKIMWSIVCLFCLFVLGWKSLLIIWGHITTVPACNSVTLTKVLPHRNAMSQTQDMTPHPVNIYRHKADLSLCYSLMLNVTLEYTTTNFNVFGVTQSGNPPLTFHPPPPRMLNFMMLVLWLSATSSVESIPYPTVITISTPLYWLLINIINIRFYIGLIRNIQLYQCLKQLQNIYFVCSLIQSITLFIFIHLRQLPVLYQYVFCLFCFCFVFFVIVFWGCF